MEKLKEKLEKISPYLNEKQRRIVFAAEAESLGRGGKTIICNYTGMSRPTLNQGFLELSSPPGTFCDIDKIRKKGAGRKNKTSDYPDLLKALESLVEPLSRGDPESALRWTIKSTRTLSEELAAKGYKVRKSRVATLLSEIGYSLQSNQKTLEGNQHPDRNAQFEHINAMAETYIKDKNPVISVDAKKKENVGNFKNNGKEYRPEKTPRKVSGHDFCDKKAVPFGIYDIAKDTGFVNVGTNYDTSSFAVHSIEQWWASVGKLNYPNAKQLLITADGGGSNGHNRKLWKYELQRFSNESGLEISVCHFPPGTSKWNKIEHRLFSHISLNWRGIPLEDYETIIQLIGATKTKSGLTVKCKLDNNQYEKGIKITNEQLEEINLDRNNFHGEWNYTIKPNKT
jgi:transposase